MANINSISNELDQISIASTHQCPPDNCSEFITNPREHLKLIQINIRSIKKNFDQFIAMLSITKIDFDIIVLTECWLKVSGPNPILQGYTCHVTVNNRSQNDGVAVFTKTSLRVTVYEPSFLEANCLVCTVDNTVVVCLYRSPSYSNLEVFSNSLNNLLCTLNHLQNLILMGDININIMPRNNDRNSDNYLTLTATHGLLPAHLLPTRSGNCLDHVLLKTKNRALVIVVQTYITDHLPVILSMKLKRSTIRNNSISKFKYDFLAIKQTIENTDFGPVMYEMNPNSAAKIFINILQEVIAANTLCIRLQNKIRVIKPWMTQGLVRCIRNRDRMHHSLKRNPENSILQTTYKRYRNYLNKLLKKLKRAYDKNELQKAKNNPKATWKAIKAITNSSSQRLSPNELLKLTNDPKSSANQVNTFFTDIGRQLASQVSPLPRSDNNVKIPPHQPPSQSLVLLPVDESQIEGLISSLRSNCASGYDNISAKILKDSKSILKLPITHIFNRAIEAGTFPDALKIAVVHPVFKSGDRANVTNYRPISVLSSLSKIFERILNSCLVTYLTKHKIIAANQFGFRPGISTEDAVADLTKSLINYMDKGMKCYGIFLDLSKAFDTVSVPILISKLENAGIRGIALDIFTDYLSYRSQRVKIDSTTSDDQSISFGVPQGSILGPSLFLLYINDLCQLQIPNCDIFTYADDTALVVYDTDWHGARKGAEQSLRLVMEWLSENLLTLNVAKTKVIRFFPTNSLTPPQESEQIKAHICSYDSLNCSCPFLSLVPSIKYLGVHIDCHLDWKCHVEALCTRIRKLIYIFKELRHCADPDTALLVYQSLCQSIILYCIPVWGGTYKTYLLKVERAQRAILKVMHFKRRDFPTTELYSQADVLTVRQLFILRAVLRKHSMLKLDSDKLNRRKGLPVCDTEKCRTKFASRQFMATSSRLYNKINKIISIYPLTKREAKIKLTKWLQKLTYDETENLFKIVS